MFSLRPASHWKALRGGTLRDSRLPASDVLAGRIEGDGWPTGASATTTDRPGRRPLNGSSSGSMSGPRGAHRETIAALLAAAEAKEPRSEQHAYRVAACAELLGGRMGLSGVELEDLVHAGLLHDVGKIGIPDAILAKPGPLTLAEYATIQRHPLIGEAILRPLDGFDRIRSLVRHHHECYDGRGYPDGLAGERIPLGARILQVADSIDAMLTPRSYKAGRTTADVVAELRRCSWTQFDPVVANLAIEWLTRG